MPKILNFPDTAIGVYQLQKNYKVLLIIRVHPKRPIPPALDPLFNSSKITNEAGQEDYPFYWSNTTHASMMGGGSAVYICFGRGMGYMNEFGGWSDVHGAGCQRSDPKVGNASDFPTGRGPQGDAIRINNYVRLVRNMP